MRSPAFPLLLVATLALAALAPAAGCSWGWDADAELEPPAGAAAFSITPETGSGPDGAAATGDDLDPDAPGERARDDGGEPDDGDRHDDDPADAAVLAAEAARAVAASRAAATTALADGDAYRLGPEDLLELSVLGEPEMNALKLRVSPLGTIEVPYVGTVHARGRTVDELRRHLERRLDEFFVRPEITIFLREYRSRTVLLFGQVHRPGPYRLTHRDTLMEVISRAGGFTDLADPERVVIVRKSGDGQRSLTVDCEAIIEDGRLDLDRTLEAGDLVQVPERIF